MAPTAAAKATGKAQAKAQAKKDDLSSAPTTKQPTPTPSKAKATDPSPAAPPGLLSRAWSWATRTVSSFADGEPSHASTMNLTELGNGKARERRNRRKASISKAGADGNPSHKLENGGDKTKWPAITKAGTDCKGCLAKGEGTFCHHHQPSSSSAKPSHKHASIVKQQQQEKKQEQGGHTSDGCRRDTNGRWHDASGRFLGQQQVRKKEKGLKQEQAQQLGKEEGEAVKDARGSPLKATQQQQEQQEQQRQQQKQQQQQQQQQQKKVQTAQQLGKEKEREAGNDAVEALTAELGAAFRAAALFGGGAGITGGLATLGGGVLAAPPGGLALARGVAATGACMRRGSFPAPSSTQQGQQGQQQGQQHGGQQEQQQGGSSRSCTSSSTSSSRSSSSRSSSTSRPPTTSSGTRRTTSPSSRSSASTRRSFGCRVPISFAPTTCPSSWRRRRTGMSKGEGGGGGGWRGWRGQGLSVCAPILHQTPSRATVPQQETERHPLLQQVPSPEWGGLPGHSRPRPTLRERSTGQDRDGQVCL